MQDLMLANIVGSLIWIAFVLASCGSQAERPAPPAVFYDEGNETVVVLSDRQDDDLFWMWFLLHASQPQVVNNSSTYTSYRTVYVKQHTTYVAPKPPAYKAPPPRANGSGSGGGSKQQPAQAPKQAPAQQPKSQPQQPKSQPQAPAPAPRPPAPAAPRK